MKKINKRLLLVLIGIIFISNINVSIAKAEENPNRKYKQVLIDPGHGGIDGGAVSKNGTLEKDLNLSIGLKLKDELMIRDYDVIMTRKKDEGLYTEGKKTIRQKKNEDLRTRCELKEHTNNDMFISIHMNMFTESKYKGAQVWYSKNEPSKRLAKILMEKLKEKLDPNNERIEKETDGKIKVLNCSKNVPSVIIECGFLSNPEEEKLLLNEEYQFKVVEAICDAIDEYFKNSNGL